MKLLKNEIREIPYDLTWGDVYSQAKRDTWKEIDDRIWRQTLHIIQNQVRFKVREQMNEIT